MLHKEVKLAVYVDDNTVTHQWPVSTVTAVVSDAARDLLNTLRVGLHVDVAMPKCSVVAPSREAPRIVHDAL
eukprot:1743456-Prorocentrum_lima.AAC.1